MRYLRLKNVSISNKERKEQRIKRSARRRAKEKEKQKVII